MANQQKISRDFYVGLIGGTGFEKSAIFKKEKSIGVITPFDEKEVILHVGHISNVPCIFLARHGSEHNISPSRINFRANLWAMMVSGVKVILATAASGSLKEQIKPGSLVFLDSFIDKTINREKTFHDGIVGHPKGVSHIPSHPSFNAKLRKVLITTAEELKLDFCASGTGICIEGPRYSSKAESLLFRQWNADIVNMTLCPEVYLAKELGIPYATTALVTDYDCWKEDFGVVTVDVVSKMLEENVSKTEKLFAAAIKKIGEIDWSEEIRAAKRIAREAIMVDQDEKFEHLNFE